MQYPRVLVIANNCFSKTNSNGRTLANLFVGWPKDKLANFFVSPVETDFESCSNYYCVSDSEVIQSLLHFRKLQKRPLSQEQPIVIPRKKQKLNKKTPLKALLRNLAWMMVDWKTDEFEKWVDDFKPDVILLMNTDAVFVLKIAEYLASSRNVPLMMYNTEGFYLFHQNYFQKGFLGNSLFKLYHRWYRKVFESVMKLNSFTFYLNGKLKEDYDMFFYQKGDVLYNVSTTRRSTKPFNSENPRFCYIGNFGYERHKALIEVGQVLNNINSNYCLEVYGNPRPEVEKLFELSRGIEYKGLLSYDEVKKTIDESDVLFHVESQSEQYRETLKYGFSTKIADSITSGKAFVIYASSDIACSQYIMKTGAGWHAGSKEELEKTIRRVLKDPMERQEKSLNAMQVAKTNHSPECVCDKFKRKIEEIAKSK